MKPKERYYKLKCGTTEEKPDICNTTGEELSLCVTCAFDNIKLAEQLKEEEYWHALFEEKVSTASSYDENERRHLSSDHSHLRPYEHHHEFYDEQKKNRKDRDFSNNEVIGYFNDYI